MAEAYLSVRMKPKATGQLHGNKQNWKRSELSELLSTRLAAVVLPRFLIPIYQAYK
jgi:hypothetical protein